MSIYIGNDKVKINLNGKLYKTPAATLKGVKLVTLDNYVLRDSNCLYLIAKEGKSQ